MMEPTNTAMQLLEKKIYHLKEKYMQQKSFIEKLEQENKQLCHTIFLQEAQAKKQPVPLIEQLPLLTTFEQGLAAEALQKRIVQYIAYIDQCISYIEKL